MMDVVDDEFEVVDDDDYLVPTPTLPAPKDPAIFSPVDFGATVYLLLRLMPLFD